MAADCPGWAEVGMEGGALVGATRAEERGSGCIAGTTGCIITSWAGAADEACGSMVLGDCAGAALRTGEAAAD